jgi:hypothetical protein
VFESELAAALIRENPQIQKAFEKKCIEAISKINTDELSKEIYQVITDDLDWLVEDIDVKAPLTKCFTEAIQKIFKGGK